MSRNIPHFYWCYKVQYIPHNKIFNGLICMKFKKKIIKKSEKHCKCTHINQKILQKGEKKEEKKNKSHET